MTHIDELGSLLKRISALAGKGHTFLVAIDGRGGCGKSTLAEKLKGKLSDVSIVHLDDFSYAETDRQRLLDQVILPLRENRSARYQRFDWGTKHLAEWYVIRPGGIVIVEGVSTLHEILYRHFNFRIWVECPPEIGFRRGLKRDLEVYRVDTTKDWIDKWMPEERRYIGEQKPQDRADYIFDTTQDIR